MNNSERKDYLNEERRKTLLAMTNPSLRGGELAYLKARLSAIEVHLASVETC